MWPIIFIYIGTLFYTLAAYYHLKIKKWTFAKAFSLALPLVIFEYIFSLNGNYFAHKNLNLSPIDILLVTLSFYFINLWILNVFILRMHTNHVKNIIAFILILSALYITYK